MLNHIVMMGRLTRDPELRQTGSGVAVASFSIACDRDFGGKDGGPQGSAACGGSSARSGWAAKRSDATGGSSAPISQPGEKETDFVDVVAWRTTAEFVSRYFTKGRMAVVSGRLQIRNWNDKDGNKRRSAEVVADNIYFGDSKPDGAAPIRPASGGVSVPPPGQDFDVLEDDDSDLPF